MKKTILSLGISLVMSGASFGQVYSNVYGAPSDPNTPHVGIGTITPQARLHVYQKPQTGMGAGPSVPHLILQNKWNSPGGLLDYSWSVTAGTGLTFSGSSVTNGANVEGYMLLHKDGLNVGYNGNSTFKIGGYTDLATIADGEYLGLGVKKDAGLWKLSRATASTNGGALIFSDLNGNLEFWSGDYGSTAPLSGYFSAANHKRMVMTNTGNLGIGTSSPTEKLVVGGNALVTGNLGIGVTSPSEKLTVAGNALLESNNAAVILKNSYVAGSGNTPSIRFQNPDNSVNWTINGSVADVHEFSITHKVGTDINSNIFHIDTDGHIGIGTTNTPAFLNNQGDDYRLFVKGGIRTEEIKVELCTGSWCDYVFAPNYDLLSLSEVEQVIKEKGHLHKIASASEIERDGLELKSMTINQQEKIEELFLHLIEMDKEIKTLKLELASLKASK